ncbi:MAG: bifunctional pyr operon transcriptional regulator/uracil phosphoribosyltransferase PyrR [Deltaproteobacteria bacterium]|nr:bifunctional pyr operon transcriptional regulator/uracil phosphoribosyltransferase PyrR [Deltaproteobacteria bacterium]
MKKSVILREDQIQERIQKIASEILARNDSPEELLLVGIRTGGAYLAGRLQEAIAAMNVPRPSAGTLDITLYRDDWTRIGTAPLVGKTELPFSIDDKVVILVDDVLFTGRTVRAAMDALIDLGRPKRIELAILVDRGDRDRELPIRADYIGALWHTSSHETVNVYLREAGFEDQVTVEEKKAA